MNAPLREFQNAFVEALLTDVARPAVAKLVAQPGFAVYRNTVMKGCIDALQANYPAVVRLVGEEWFRAAAAVYVRKHPPVDVRMLQYGADFSAFLREFAPALELPYLPDVARLDRFWTEAHSAADESPLDAADLASADVTKLTLKVHPSARWAWFADQPIYSIWSASREGRAFDGDLLWKGEAALLTRADGAVVWRQVSRGICAFLDACFDGLAVPQAAAAAIEAEPDIDIAQTIASLFAVHAFGARTL